MKESTMETIVASSFSRTTKPSVGFSHRKPRREHYNNKNSFLDEADMNS
jgi:hypothetical protein